MRTATTHLLDFDHPCWLLRDMKNRVPHGNELANSRVRVRELTKTVRILDCSQAIGFSSRRRSEMR